MPGGEDRGARHFFPRAVRLTRRQEFTRVFQRAVRVSEDGLTLLARPNGRDHPRLGLAISRKHARTIAARNRVKRVVRESFRRHQQRLGGLDIVATSRSGLDPRDKQALTAVLERLWPELIQRCERSSSF
ncbi:MAG: ribonuclease P protein component [Gammaproteobacteria bacterium]|nr:ribonuclease P protein component [Gammaproteobacteria bacterium]